MALVPIPGGRATRLAASVRRPGWLLALALVLLLLVDLGADLRGRDGPAPESVPTPAPAPGAVLEPAAPPAPPTVAFLGDATTAGQGASSPGARWSTLLSGEQGWVELNLGVPGTGYAADGSFPGQRAYARRVADVVAGAPDAVVVSGGRSDELTDNDYADSVGQVFVELRQGLPQARLVATSPVWDDDVPPEELAELGRVVRSQVENVGGTYLDVGQPLQGRPELVGPDGVQPDDAGHAAIAAAVDEAMAGADLLPVTAP